LSSIPFLFLSLLWASKYIVLSYVSMLRFILLLIGYVIT
jgi:hypothetical protein